MTVTCVAYNCKSYREKGVTFHRFPHNNPKLLKKWITNLRWQNWTPCPNTMICSKHFEERYFSRTKIRGRLKRGAVPTIFEFPPPQNTRKYAINPRSKRAKGLDADSSFASPPNTAKHTQAYSSGQGLEEPSPYIANSGEHACTSDSTVISSDPLGSLLDGSTLSTLTVIEPVITHIPWSIQGDSTLSRRLTLPSFFHNNYCLPQSLQWPGDAEANVEHYNEATKEASVQSIIKITERWQWLGLDFRGPLQTTMTGHKFVLTITDYHSKWVEAFPVTGLLSPEVVWILCDLFAQFGYPMGILCRLNLNTTIKLNQSLKNRLQTLKGSMIIRHRQTGYLDSATESLIDSMVTELMTDHAESWNLHLPASVLRLCCKVHPTTGESPFTRMQSKEPRPVTTPRELPYPVSILQECSFVIDSPQTSGDTILLTQLKVNGESAEEGLSR
ncbi:uncharacterized protein LOC114794440 isoform X2 [Denticeps clupeoides]|uniref:THAP domain-containing protein 1 n=1 Tax=Denticeps clupeoides TaxID=299321 RepID=A0AAY4DDX3_9TELE|nr:uncharacterized protein LOC114794440 isoform X2 [Denticeps clupeoides]